MIQKIIVFSLVLFSFVSCIENLGEFESTQSFYVVNGQITNEYGPHKITLRNTAYKFELAELTELNGSQAVIVDDLGQITALKTIDVGDFLTPDDFRAESGRSYQIQIVLTNGVKITSAMEKLVEAPEVDDFTWEVETRELLGDDNVIYEEKFVIFKASYCDPEGVDNYYKWDYEGTYEYMAYLSELQWLNYQLDRAIELGLQNRFCWKKFYGQNTLNIGSDLLYDGSCKDDVIVFERKIDEYFQIAAYFELIQYGLNANEYKYLSELEKQLANKGTIFETGNYQINGNLTIESSEDLVLGYFGVRAVSKTNAFITAVEVEYTHSYESCIAEGFNPTLPNYCFDCRSQGALSTENLRPDYWPR